MKTYRAIFFVSVLSLLAVVLSARAQQVLQDLVNNATGPVITVPAGNYLGPVKLPEGVLLVGAGADKTTLTVPGGATGVTGENKSGIVGFTIKGGVHGVRTLGHFMGVFECWFEGQTDSALYFEGASGACANNVIVGTPTNTRGVVVIRSNPLIVNNVIVSNSIGLFVSDVLIPVVEDNLFIANDTAVLVDSNAHVHLVRNLYDGNRVAVQGADLGPDDEIKAISWNGSLPHAGSNPQQYIDLINVVFTDALNVHPCVIYGLGPELGSFDVEILSPSATFSIGVSAPDTIIQQHFAYDSVTRGDLASSLRFNDRPWVDVINPAVKDLATDRYVLQNRYVHGPSYLVNPQGQRVFNRITTLSRVEVFCPAGWLPVSVNYQANFEIVNEQVVVKIVNPGLTTVTIVMEPAATAADPYNVRALFSAATK